MILYFLIHGSEKLKGEHKCTVRRMLAGGKHETNCALQITEIFREVGPVLDVVRRAVVRVYPPLPWLVPSTAIALLCPCPMEWALFG